MFENFYERFLDHINTSYDLIHPMDENKQVEKFLASLTTCFIKRVIAIEMFHKLKNLTIHELISNLQAFDIHHFIPKKGKVVTDKGKSLALKSTKLVSTRKR